MNESTVCPAQQVEAAKLAQLPQLQQLAIPLTLQRIQAAIDYIEENLHNDFSIRDLAQQAQMSQWHFQRVFHASAGETVKAYIRSRRLSHAARALLETDLNILQIALEAGFDSNEAFTRAFRQQFALTPRQFRQQKQALSFPRLKLQIDQHYLQHLHRNLSLNPRIEYSGSLHLVGIPADFTVAHEDFDLLTLLRPVWDRFYQALPQIQGRSEQEACLLCEILASSERQIRVFALPCVVVRDFSNLPAGMISHVRAAQKNAIFRHAGSGQAWEYTMQYIFGAWLPESGHALADGGMFCRFLPEHSPFAARPELDYYVALA